MRVNLEKEYKRYYTLEQLDQAKAVIATEKEDEETAKGWAVYAVNEALKGTGEYFRDEILKAEAHTARNCRAWNLYGEGTGEMDVWVEILARTSEGFMECGAYLSDIWQSGAVEYKQHMYIQRYGRI